MNLEDEVFVCVDCESTGLDPHRDRMIEVACATFTLKEGVLRSFETLVNPECLIPPESQEIHKISQEQLIDKPKAKEILPRVLDFIKNHTVVGHAVSFDLNLLAAEAARAQIPNTLNAQAYIDTLRLARLYGESPINSLDALRKHFNIAFDGMHRAMSDVLINIEVFKFLAQGYQTSEQILQALRKPVKMRAMPLGKHKGRRFEEIPLEYLLWAEKQDFDQDLLFSLRSEIRNRRKKKSFEQSTNPFAKL